MTAPLLQIEDLKVTFSTRRGLVEAVRGITLSLEPGEMLGLVGASCSRGRTSPGRRLRISASCMVPRWR
jgi:ABC-type dipeptide/oligopeptide/nickel transport system ATPase component